MRRPDDLPRSEEPLVLREADVPHFGAGNDEIIMAKEPSIEEADKALDSEDEELNPWRRRLYGTSCKPNPKLSNML